MAKKDDFDDIEDFEDFDFDDLDDEFNDEASKTASSSKKKDKKNTRKAVESVIKDAYDAAKDNIKSKSVKDHAAKILEASLHNDAKSAFNDLKYELGKMQEEANKQLDPLKKGIANITKSLSDSLPKGKVTNLLDNLTKKLKSDTQSGFAEQKETLFDFKNSFESALSDVDDRIAGLSSELTSKQSKLNSELAKRQYTTLMAMREQDRIFYNKSLELQWKMSTGIEETLKLQRAQFQTFSTQFESIIKNTSLPEAVKLHNAEVAGMVMKQKAFGSLSESIFKKVNPLEKFTLATNRRLREILLDARDSTDSRSDALGMASDFKDMQEMGMSKASLAGGLGSDFLLGLVYEKLGKALPKNIRNKLSGNIIGLASNPLDYLKSLKSKNPTGLIGKLFNKGIEGIEDIVPSGTPFNNTKLNKAELDSQALFDGRTYSSINTVIPLLLSKIHSEVHGLRTGKNVTEDDELRFNEKTQSFISASDMNKQMRSHIAEDMVSYARSRAKGMQKEVAERLQNYQTPNKNKIISKLDKWFISYITEYGAISPEAMSTPRFLKFVPNDLQLEAADLFAAFLKDLRVGGNSKGIYDLFANSADFLRMSPAMMQQYATGMNSGLAVRNGLININGLNGATTVNGEGVKNIFKRAARSRTYNVNAGLYNDDMDWGDDSSLREGLRNDWNNIRSGVRNLNSGLEEGDYVGAHGTRMFRSARMSEEEQAAQSYRLRREQFIREFNMDPENIQLKKTDPERYQRKLDRALAKFDRDPTIKRLFRFMRGEANRRMAQFQATGTYQRGSGAMHRAFDRGNAFVNGKMPNVKNFFNDKYEKGTSYAKSQFDKVYTYGSEFLNSQGVPSGVTLEDIRQYTQAGLDSTFAKLNESYKAAKEDKAKVIAQAKDNLIREVSKVLPPEQLEAAKAYIQMADPKEIYEDAINKTKASMNEGKEITELAIRASHGDQEALDDLKEKASGLGEATAKKYDTLKDELLDLANTAKRKKEEIAKKLNDKFNPKEKLDAIKKKKASGRTAEEREILMDAKVDAVFNAIGTTLGMLANPMGMMKEYGKKGLVGALKMPFKLPYKIWTSGTAKSLRKKERELYGKMGRKAIEMLPNAAWGLVKAPFQAVGYMGKGIGTGLGMLADAWNLPIPKALRKKERQMLGIGGGISRDDNLYEENDPDAPKNKNSWWNRLKAKAGPKKDTAVKEVKAPEKGEGLFSKLKGLLMPAIGFLGAISTGIGKVIDAVTSVGGLINGGFNMLGGLLGKGVTGVVKGAISLGGKALEAGGKIVSKVAETKVGSKIAKAGGEVMTAVSKTSIAKKIIGILKSFNTTILKRLGTKAGGRFIAIVAGKIAARAVPILGWGMLIYDAAMCIKYMAVDGLDLKSAVSKAVLGFDLFNDDDPVLDENGEPVKPDEPDVAKKKDEILSKESKDTKTYMVDNKEVSKEEYDKAMKANEGKAPGEQPHKAFATETTVVNKAADAAKQRYLDFLNAFNKLTADERSVKIPAEVGTQKIVYGDLEERRFYNLGEPTNNIFWDCLTSDSALAIKRTTDKETSYESISREDYLKMLRSLDTPTAKEAIKVVSGEDNPDLTDLKATYGTWLTNKIWKIQDAIVAKAKEAKSSGGVMDVLKKILSAAFGGSNTNKVTVPNNSNNPNNNYNNNRAIRDGLINRDNKATMPSNNDFFSKANSVSSSINDKPRTSKENQAKGMTKENLMNIAIRSMNKLGWSPREQAMFLANVQHETGNYQWFAELGGAQYLSRYDGRKDLGNTSPGDGARYKGRGLIHLTGRANYADIGARMGVDLVKYPQLLEDDPKLAVASAIAWWERQKEKFPKFRQAIENDDIETVNRGVNGGNNGMIERIKYYNEFKKQLGADQGDSSTANAKGEMFQQALKGDFASTKGTDGINSPEHVNTSVQGANQGYNSSSGYTNNYQSVNIDTSNLPDKSKALVDTINKTAGDSSRSQCATNVREALESSGFTTSDGSTITEKYKKAGLAASAYMYDTNGILEDVGFKKIDPNTSPVPGDIEVFGRSNNIKHGHIQVFNGDHWVSDFHQTGGSKTRPYGSPGTKYGNMVPSLYRYDPATENLKPENIGDSSTDGPDTPTTGYSASAASDGSTYTSPTDLEAQKAASSNMAVDSLATTMTENNSIQTNQLDVNKQMLSTMEDIKTLLAKSNTVDDPYAANRVQNLREQQRAAGKENLKPVDVNGLTANNTNLPRVRPPGVVGQEKLKTM